MIDIYIGKLDTKNTSPTEILDVGIFEIGQVIEMVQSPDLFGEKKTYRITNLDVYDEKKEELFKRISELANTPNDVIFVLESLLATDKKKIEKFATIHELKIVKEKKEPFNAFALGNAFAAGDRKKTWMVFQELLQHDDEMEKTHGLVWWKLKDMVQKKSMFSETQLQSMARDLVTAYHQSRTGGIGLQERLELFFLNLPEIKK